MTQDFTEYHRLMRALATPVLRACYEHGPLQPTRWGGGRDAVPIGLAVPAALLLIDDDARMYAGLSDGIRSLAALRRAQHDDRPGYPSAVVDGAGHHRDVYGPFALHLHLRAFGVRYESVPAQLWSRCEDALEDAVRPAHVIERYVDHPPEPAEVSMVLWMALCVCEHAVLTSRDVSLDVVDAVVRQIVTHNEPDRALHAQAHPGFKSLDGWTYEELSGLHALANLAVIRRNRSWAQRVEQIAEYHLNHTQPDHITNQPWGVFAFAWSQKTRSFADQQIHDAQIHLSRPNDPAAAANVADPIAAMLLADAAATFAMFAP